MILHEEKVFRRSNEHLNVIYDENKRDKSHFWSRNSGNSNPELKVDNLARFTIAR